MNENLPTRKLNRLMARKPRLGFTWCWCCDRDVVGDGDKCRVCGKRNGKRRKHRNEMPI